MLSRRLGVDDEVVERVVHPDDAYVISDVLFEKAFSAGPGDPIAASVLLAHAILRKAQETPEGRLKSALCLVARLVANADAKKTLGPKGRSTRDELMPAGWKETMGSWPKFRYAWREGLVDLLEPSEDEHATVEALDELTRMHSNEPEPVSVHIQEVFPSPPVSFALSALATILALRTAVVEVRRYRKPGKGQR